MSEPATPSVARRTAIGALWMIGWRSATRLLGFVSTLVLARLLVPADFGLVAIATSLLAVIESLSELGLRDALVRHHESSRSLDDTAFTMQAIRGLASGVVIGAGAWISARWFGDERLVPLTLILAAVAVVSGLENIAVVRFQRELRFDVQFRLLLWPRLIQFSVTLVAALLWRDYWALILGVVVARSARVIMTYVVQPYVPRFTLASWRDLVGFSFWSWASSMVGMVQQRCDAFLLGPALGAAQLGVYFVATEIASLPASEVISPAATALFAGLAAARNSGSDVRRVAVPLIGMLIAGIAPFSLGISATAGYVVAGLLGPKWAGARPVIAIVALTCAIVPIGYVAVTVMNATGRIHRGVYAKIGSALVKVGALLVVVRFPRLEWIALALAFVSVAENAMYAWQLSRSERVDWRSSLPGFARTVAACLIVALLLRSLGAGWTEVAMPAPRALLVGGAIGAATVALCFGVQFLLWWAAGRPEGAESRLLDLAKQTLPRVWRRFHPA
ncbi:MAG TPA: oligosaccharide flippase family protein [Acetobacteraceae bacterium]|nr:oligosaccharide flippase family protein [Acetobacteraceae bacterium]